MYIYSVSVKCAKKAKYLMGILWVWYGYPMVRADNVLYFCSLKLKLCKHN